MFCSVYAILKGTGGSFQRAKKENCDFVFVTIFLAQPRGDARYVTRVEHAKFHLNTEQYVYYQ
jgi:hypothetical protein